MAEKDIKSGKEEVITINVQPFLLPGALIISSIIMSASFLIGLGNLTTNGGSIKVQDDSGTGTDTTGTDTGTTGSSGQTVYTLADTVGVDASQFKTCYDSKERQSEIDKDISDGSAAGISGTPGFIIGKVSNGQITNGILVSGALPYSAFEGITNDVINGTSKNIDAMVTQYQGSVTKNAKVSLDDDPVLGDKNLNVAIVEFTDLECPFCQRHSQQVYPEIVKNFVNNGKAKYIIRDYPLSFHNPASNNAHLAAGCVFKLGGDKKFFDFADLYFTDTKTGGAGL